MRRVIVPALVAAGLALVVAGTGAAAGRRDGEDPPRQARHVPRRPQWPHAVPVREGQDQEEHVLRRLRDGVAAAAHDRQAEGGRARRKASLLGTTKRTDGTLQVTYKGHPLYYFVQDKKAGDTTGEGIDGFGAEWYVVGPYGKKIEDD